MDSAPLKDLDSLDMEALKALVLAHQAELASLIAARDQELRRLEAELESHRQTLCEQADELRSRSERIEHMKFMIEKLRRMLFGAKSEKVVLQLEQLELQLEELETAQAEMETAVDGLAGRRTEDETRTQAAARTSSPRSDHAPSSWRLLPRLRRAAARVRRRCV
jgi:capsule polysaccharide export protein KpsE/RkpR